MQRYFIKLSYKGTNFSGWQRQANAHTVQEEIEDAVQLLLRKKINIIGCGRTDSGVHARNYIAHFDLEHDLDVDLVFKLNHVISKDIVIHGVTPVDHTRHARFDATKRRYVYTIKGIVDPFEHEFAFYYPLLHKVNIDMLNVAADILFDYKDFFTFCKSKTDVKTTFCEIMESRWEWIDDNTLRYSISANRFLRGMVRLIVGMCLNLALNKLNLKEVKDAIGNKKRLHRDWSVAAQGLILQDIRYPYELNFQDREFEVLEGNLLDVDAIVHQFDLSKNDDVGSELRDIEKKFKTKTFLIRKASMLVAVLFSYNDRQSCVLHFGIVHPTFRRIGLASDLLRHVIGWAESEGCNQLCIYSGKHDTEVNSFAIKSSFDIDSISGEDKKNSNILSWIRPL